MLNYIKTGNGSPLIFIHGALVSSQMWKNQVDFLQDKFQVITIDLPEHGQSKKIQLDHYTIDQVSEMVLTTLSKIGLKRFHLCGHSLGGMVAQDIAIRFPGKIKSLILAETSFGTAYTFFERLLTAFTKLTLKLISQKQLIRWSVSSYGKRNTVSKAYLEDEMDRFSIKQTRKIMTAALKYSSKERLPELKSPTLILAGDKNRQTHNQAKVMQQLIPHSRLEFIPEAHHLLNIDNPDYFNKTITGFLREIKPGLPEKNPGYKEY